MQNYSTFVGMDVHKNSIEIAIAESGRTGEVRRYGAIDNTLTALDKVVRKLVSTGGRLHFVYEAGPCGYGLYRHLTAQGFDCDVVAPSMVPRKSGDRIKNDRRDACNLARLDRAGELTPVYVPRAEDEAIRDLTRAREDAKTDEKRAKQLLKSFLLRYDVRYAGAASWSAAHWRWLSDITMDHPGQQIVLQEYIDAIGECSRRVHRLTDQIQQMVAHWRMSEVVTALQALRGVSLIVAATTVAEIGDLNRFTSPVELMCYLGLVPSEHSSGEKTRRGSITKSGNTHVRRVLTEAAWSYRLPAKVGRGLLKRQEELPEKVCAISWKAQVRLCSRFRQLWAKGKPKQVVVTAIARELCAFMWAIAREIEIPSST